MELNEEKLKAFDKIEDEKSFNREYLPILRASGLIGRTLPRSHRYIDYYSGGWKTDNAISGLAITGFAVGASSGKMFIKTAQTGDKLVFRIDDYFELSSR